MVVVYIANIFSQCITCLFTLFRLPLGKTKILDIVKFIYLLYVSQCFFCFKISFPTLRYKRYSHLFSAKVFLIFYSYFTSSYKERTWFNLFWFNLFIFPQFYLLTVPLLHWLNMWPLSYTRVPCCMNLSELHRCSILS